MGILMVGLAIALMIVNVILMFVVHIYYPYFYSLGAVIWWGGAWMLITGQPKATDGREPLADVGSHRARSVPSWACSWAS